MLIAVFAHSPAHLLEYSGATDVFSEAAFRSGGKADYTVRIIAETTDPIVCLSGARVIPDQAEMGLTVRTYKADIRKQMLAAIARITKAEAQAAGAPREPSIEHYEGTDAVYNDPALALRLRVPLESALGKLDPRSRRRAVVVCAQK